MTKEEFTKAVQEALEQIIDDPTETHVQLLAGALLGRGVKMVPLTMTDKLQLGLKRMDSNTKNAVTKGRS